MFDIKLVGGVSFAALFLGLMMLGHTGRQGQSGQADKAPTFPFKITNETTYEKSKNSSWRSATITLAPQHYSRDNLSALFRWYMKKHPDRTEVLDVRVFLDTLVPENKGLPSNTHGKMPAATFMRGMDEGNPSPGDNAWYHYYPGIDIRNFDKITIFEKLDAQKWVYLMGGPRLGPKDIIERWETSDTAFKIIATCYEIALDNTEPKGFYYAFYHCSTESAEVDNVGNCQNIVTFRQDNLTAIPSGQVRFVSDQVGYIFIGSLYAVTTDGAKTWHKWDADRDIPNWQCCDPTLIHDVRISPDGNGVMQLNVSDLPTGLAETLYTQDYGKHWSSD